MHIGGRFKMRDLKSKSYFYYSRYLNPVTEIPISDISAIFAGYGDIQK